MKVESHLDFGKKAQIIQVTLQKVNSLPSPGWAGGVVYLQSDHKVYYHNGTAWIAINDTAGLITSIDAGAGIQVTGTGNSRKVTFDPDGSTLENTAGDAGKARIKAGGVDTVHLATDAVETVKIRNAAVTSAKIGNKEVKRTNIDDKAVDTAQMEDRAVTTDKINDEAVTTVKITDKNVTFSKIQDLPTMTVIGRVSGGAGPSSAVTVLSDLSGVIANHDSVSSAKAIKDYVDGLVGGLGSLVGGWSAASNNNFPSGAKKGDYWYITADGTIQGIEFIEGDVIIASKDGASTTAPGDWIPLKTKRGQATTTSLGLVKLSTTAEAQGFSNPEKALTPANLADVRASDAEAQGSSNARFITPQGLHNRTATTTRRGIAEIATQAEVNTGTDASRIVTPATLHTFVDNAMSVYGKFVANIGNGSATQYTVTHSFNTKDVQTELYANASGETVLADVKRSSSDAVTVSFAQAPASNEFRIVIKK